jgi:hypothetical protein
MPRVVLALLLLAAVSGCTPPRYGLDSCLPHGSSTPANLTTVTSLRYRVRTDAGKAAAQEVSRFMERAAALWTPLLGVPAPGSLPLEVLLLGDPVDLARVLSSQKLPVTATGLYLPAPTPMIHVACRGAEPGHPYRTLLHEGTHQFIHLGAGYRVPGQPTATPPRLTLPLWLNEGLASYYEAAYLTPDLLQPGRPEAARLAELQRALQRGKAPPLSEILERRYGDSFTTLDYAVAWGVVYALMQEAPPAWAAGGRAWLKALIDEARQGWPGATTLPAPTTAASHDEWWATVTERTRAAFAAFAAERGLTVSAWEAQWHDWILAHPPS